MAIIRGIGSSGLPMYRRPEEYAAMMGNRGSANGTETDAFSRRSRSLLHWKPGRLRRLKRAFGKRQRQVAKQDLSVDFL